MKDVMYACGNCGTPKKEKSQEPCVRCGLMGVPVIATPRHAARLQDNYEAYQRRQTLQDEAKKKYIAEHGLKAWNDKLEREIREVLHGTRFQGN